MPGKPLKTLAGQLKKNQGVLFVPTFDTGIEPGSLLEVKGWNRITRIGHLKNGIKASRLPPVGPPKAYLFHDFMRSHELQLNAALELLKPKGQAKATFQRAKEAVATFNSPVSYTMSLMELEDAVEGDSRIWSKTLGQYLLLRSTRVVFQVIRGGISFFFRDSGGSGVDLKSTNLGNLSAAGLGANWKWRNEATLESKREVVIAVEPARYLKGKKRFKPTV